MKLSVCITVFNEEKSISDLINSLLKQTKKPDEIIVVDGGSSDKTIDIIKHFKRKNKKIKFLTKKCSRSKGRNLSVELANNEIIAMTDAGCVAKKNWLEKISEPFKNNKIEIVAGFYDMIANTSFQKAISVFLGTLPDQFNVRFLPSTRSIAFRKSVWEKVGGFSENLDDTAEDTMFNYKLIKEGINISRVKSARVEWDMPETLNVFYKKIFLYAKGDAKSGVVKFPTKGIMSHNVKIFLKIIRYILFLLMFTLGLINNSIYIYTLLLILLVYSFYSFNKVYVEMKDIKAGLWGIILQFTSDFAGIAGFIVGKL